VRTALAELILPQASPLNGEVYDRIDAERLAGVLKALADADVRHKLEDLGFAVRGSSPEELGAMTRDQLAKYARVMKEMGIANE